MSVSLAHLLHIDEKDLAGKLSRLELHSGLPGIDVRLVAEIIGSVHMKSRELGLDPKDSTGPELYQSLLGLAARHDNYLCLRFGISDMRLAPEKLVHVLQSLSLKKEVWAIKSSSLKKLLKAMPPKNCMKALGYRSVDSLLKREPAAVLVAAARIIESPQWLQKFIAGYAKFTPADFENRSVEFVYLDSAKWGSAVNSYVKSKSYHVMSANEVGVVGLLPIGQTPSRGYCLLTATLLLQALMEQRFYSAYFKLLQTKPQFGRLIAHNIASNQAGHIILAGEKVHWQTVARFLAHKKAHPHYEQFEPHLTAEDLISQTPEEALYSVEPALHFWYGTSFLASINEPLPISFNLIDMAINYANGLSYKQRSTLYYRESLWNELYMRYLCQDNIAVRTIEQLESEIFDRQLEKIRQGAA